MRNSRSSSAVSKTSTVSEPATSAVRSLRLNNPCPYEPSRFFRYRFSYRPAIVHLPHSLSCGGAHLPLLFRRVGYFCLTRENSANRHPLPLRFGNISFLRYRDHQAFAGFRFERGARRAHARLFRGFRRMNVFFSAVRRCRERWNIASRVWRLGIGAEFLSHDKNRFLLLKR